MNTKMKRFISSLLAMTLAFGVSVNVSATQFADTSGHWALTSIDKWSDLGVMNGYDGLFRPNDPVTLAEFSVILCQIMGYTKTSSARLADVDDQYYATAIRKMVAAGILSPDRERNIYPEANLTRHGMATMLARAFKISPQKGGTSFIDDDNIPDYAKGYVKALRDKGYLAGYSTDRGYEFRPHNNLTRAEAIVLIEQLASVLVNSPGTYAENVNGNLVVNTGGVTLSNLTVSGDLYLAEGIAEGDVRLENVTVEGEMFVRGGGVNSIYIVDSKIGTMVVDKSDGDIRIVATGTTKVSAMVLESGAIVVVSELTSGAIDVLTISNTSLGQQIALVGAFETVVNSANNARIDLQGSVQSLMLNASANLSGTGIVVNCSVSPSAATNVALSGTSNIVVQNGGDVFVQNTSQVPESALETTTADKSSESSAPTAETSREPENNDDDDNDNPPVDTDSDYTVFPETSTDTIAVTTTGADATETAATEETSTDVVTITAVLSETMAMIETDTRYVVNTATLIPGIGTVSYNTEAETAVPTETLGLTETEALTGILTGTLTEVDTLTDTATGIDSETVTLTGVSTETVAQTVITVTTVGLTETGVSTVSETETAYNTIGKLKRSTRR